MWHKVNFHQLVVQLMPTFLRKPRHISFLMLFSTEIQDVYNNWKEKRKRDLIWLNHNSQVFLIEKILNDEFDNLDRRIRILDSVLYEPQYVWTLGENNPMILYKLNEMQPSDVEDIYIWQDNDYDGGVDFYVALPYQMNVEALTIQISAVLKRYKLASKRFKLINYE